MRQVAWEDAAGARVLEAQLLARIDDKAGALVMAERLRMIEGPGMHPKAADRPLPGAVGRRLQQKRPEPAADEFRDQPEIAQLGFLRHRGIELEIAGRNAAEVKHEDLGG